jgi:hypothetical protein
MPSIMLLKMEFNMRSKIDWLIGLKFSQKSLQIHTFRKVKLKLELYVNGKEKTSKGNRN